MSDGGFVLCDISLHPQWLCSPYPGGGSKDAISASGTDEVKASRSATLPPNAFADNSWTSATYAPRRAIRWFDQTTRASNRLLHSPCATCRRFLHRFRDLQQQPFPA